MSYQAVVGGVLVAGLGFAAYLALSKDEEPQVPVVATQPSWDQTTVNAISAAESDYQSSVVTSGTNVMDLIMNSTSYVPAQQVDLGIPAVPNMSVHTFVQPVEQDPAVQDYINQAAQAQDPSLNQTIKDVPWYYWLSPVTAGYELYESITSYQENQKSYDTMQANAANMKAQLSADQYQVVTNEGELNFQAWFKYEEDVSLTTGNPFNWNDTYAAAAYLAVNAPDQYDAFLRAWDEYGAADQQEYLSKLQTAMPQPPVKPQSNPALSKEEQQAQLDAYDQANSDFKAQYTQYKAMVESAKTMELDQTDISKTLQTAYNLNDKDAADLGAEYYQAFTNKGTFGGNIMGAIVNQTLTTMTPESADDPTYTLSDGSVVDIYSGYVTQSGSVLKQGDKAFEVTANGDVVQKL